MFGVFEVWSASMHTGNWVINYQAEIDMYREYSISKCWLVPPRPLLHTPFLQNCRCAHTHTRCKRFQLHFIFAEKLTRSEPNCVCHNCMLVKGCTLIRSALTANRLRAPNTNQWDWSGGRMTTGWGEERKCSLMHSFRSCAFTTVNVAGTYATVFAVWKTAQRLACEVADSFIMACAHREMVWSRGKKNRDRTGQV